MITERMIANVMPMNEPMRTFEIRDALGLPHIPTKVFASHLREMRKAGILTMHKRSNRAHEWTRIRKAQTTNESPRKRSLEVEVVQVGDSNVSLPKMPAFRSLEEA